MAVTVADKAGTQHASGTNPFTWNQTGWAGQGIVVVGQCTQDAAPTVSGGGVTWTQRLSVNWSTAGAGLRMTTLFTADGTPADGNLTITLGADVNAVIMSGTISGWDGTLGTPQSASGESASLLCPDVGTIGSGTVIFAAGSLNGAAITADAGSTLVREDDSPGADPYRAMAWGYSTTDSTPSCTAALDKWGIVGAVFNAAGGGGGGSVFSFPHPTLGGAAVDVGDGSARMRHLNIPAAEYGTPFWIVPDSETNRAVRVDALPIALDLYCGTISASSSEP